MPKPATRLALIAVVVLITGCGTAPRSESEVQQTATVRATDSVEPSPGPPHVDSSPTESEVETANPEAYLLSGFRTDPAVGEPIDLGLCAPRREGLPGNATHGIECMIAEGPTEQVGAYLFPTAEDARRVYEERLTQYGVDLGTFRGFDSCGNEGPMHPEPPGEEHLVPREGTFLNENGVANLRAVFPREAVYVGVLGRTDDCRAVYIWAHFPLELGVTPNPVNVWSPPLGGN